jgi:hypothetical protein
MLLATTAYRYSRHPENEHQTAPPNLAGSVSHSQTSGVTAQPVARPVIVEFIGTCFLMLTIGTAIVDDEPPAIAQVAQDAVSWLARSVVELDRDSPETPEAFAEVLARLLAVGVSARIAAVH